MASNDGFSSLNAIKAFKTTWKIQVKIVHCWNQYSTYSVETMEMILADSSGTLIHATIKKPLLNKYQRSIVAGEWKIIENFTLAKSMGKYRATKHALKMSFTNLTIVLPSPSISDDMYLDLANFDALAVDNGLNENILVDVIGQLVNVGEMKTHETSNNKTTRKIECELRDTSDQRLSCTLWGRYADTLLASCDTNNNTSVIVLLRFAKISSYKGQRSIGNSYDMSLLLINGNYKEFAGFVKE